VSFLFVASQTGVNSSKISFSWLPAVAKVNGRYVCGFAVTQFLEVSGVGGNRTYLSKVWIICSTNSVDNKKL